jgi:predicted MFS family arabinose efflux permease
MASFDRRGRVVVLAIAAQMLGLAVGPALGASVIAPGQYASVNYIAIVMFGFSWVCILPPVFIQQQRARSRQLGWGTS